MTPTKQFSKGFRALETAAVRPSWGSVWREMVTWHSRLTTSSTRRREMVKQSNELFHGCLKLVFPSWRYASCRHSWDHHPTLLNCQITLVLILAVSQTVALVKKYLRKAYLELLLQDWAPTQPCKTVSDPKQVPQIGSCWLLTLLSGQHFKHELLPPQIALLTCSEERDECSLISVCANDIFPLPQANK